MIDPVAEEVALEQLDSVKNAQRDLTVAFRRCVQWVMQSDDPDARRLAAGLRVAMTRAEAESIGADMVLHEFVK